MALVVKGNVREIAKEEGMGVSQDADKALEEAFEDMIRKAIYRAKENGRHTIKGRDV